MFNFSPHAQPATLYLPEFSGYTPVEVLGGAEFPTIQQERDGELVLTMEPHGFFWFVLEKRERLVPTEQSRSSRWFDAGSDVAKHESLTLTQ